MRNEGTMRKLQCTISTFGNNMGNTLVRQGNKLIVRGEVLRTLCANSLDALALYASWAWPGVMYGVKPCVRTAVCFATVKQTTRQHAIACRYRASA